MNAPFKRDQFVWSSDAIDFAGRIPDGCIDLLAIDPPFYGIVAEEWDNQWSNVAEFVAWFAAILRAFKPKMKPRGSLVFFGGIGKHGERALFNSMDAIEGENLYTFRNLITWKKRRAYGKSHDYLFCREEIAWYSVSSARTEVTFNIPLLNEKRGYAGFNPKYQAKSEFKRVSNVWDDIPELMRPERTCQKPLPLMDRIIQTHSNPGDLVVDCFTGWGATGVSAVQNGRDFLGCEKGSRKEHDAAQRANMRVLRAATDSTAFRTQPIETPAQPDGAYTQEMTER